MRYELANPTHLQLVAFWLLI